MRWSDPILLIESAALSLSGLINMKPMNNISSILGGGG